MQLATGLRSIAPTDALSVPASCETSHPIVCRVFFRNGGKGRPPRNVRFVRFRDSHGSSATRGEVVADARGATLAASAIGQKRVQRAYRGLGRSSEPSIVRIYPKPMLRGCTRRYAAKAVLHACCAVLIASVPTLAGAESLRCNGQSVSEGDTRLALRYNCGEPLMADTYCAPVYYAPTFQPVPEPFASVVVPCQLVEEWLYDRGPGLLLAVVRIRSGVVQSIHYGR